MLSTHSYVTKSGFTFHYYLHTPDQATKGMPLLVFLHGAGEVGNSIEELIHLHKNMALLPHIEEGRVSLPAYGLFPQCPKKYRWSDIVIFLKELIDHMIEELSSDRDRIYLTGISMGGYGTWSMAAANPTMFAAIAPICGGGMAWAARTSLTHMPIWAFHGDADDVVLPRNSIEMVDEINKYGGNAKLTIFHGVGHNSWDDAYLNTRLIPWLLEQKK